MLIEGERKLKSEYEFYNYSQGYVVGLTSREE